MAATALAALLLSAAAAPHVTAETLDANRFRLTTIYVTGDIELHVRAQLRLREEAERLCRGRGRAVSEGSLEINQVPGRRGRIALSEVYNCIVPSAR